MYSVDPDNIFKSVPKARPVEAHGRATIPSPQEINNRPDYVILNNSGSYLFAYESGSLDTYVTGSVIKDVTSGIPVTLEIQPVAWDSVGGAKGDVTFVYKGAV